MLSMLLGRRGAIKLLFYAQSPMMYIMFRPIHDRLVRDQRFDVFFAGRLFGKQASKAMVTMLGMPRVCPIRRGFATLCQFDLMLMADYMWHKFKQRPLPISKTPKVQLFHGASVRNAAIQQKMTFYHHLFVIGPYMYRSFVKQGFFEDGDPRLLHVGMPKTDRLVNGELDGEHIRQQLGLDPARPTVMLAPTWLRQSPLSLYGERLLDLLIQGPWNVLIKLHHKYFDPRRNAVDWHQLLARYRQFPHCRVIDDYDAIPSLYVTDLLISDVSSIANEFTLLDRPLVYLKVPGEDALAQEFPFLDLQTWGQRPGEVVESPETCVAAVERALSNPGKHSAVRQALAKDIFYNPGTATTVAVEKLYDLLGLDAPAVP